MGRRSRKRGPAGSPTTAATRERPAAPAAGRQPPRAPSRRAKLDEAPKPPWHPFPLTEICIFIALVLLVLGFVGGADARPRLLLAGFILVALAAGELSVREHFAGYRSHTSLLSGICAVFAVVPLALAGVPRIAALGVGVAVFAAAFGLLRSAFAKRSGGLGFRA